MDLRSCDILDSDDEEHISHNSINMKMYMKCNAKENVYNICKSDDDFFEQYKKDILSNYDNIMYNAAVKLRKVYNLNEHINNFIYRKK